MVQESVGKNDHKTGISQEKEAKARPNVDRVLENLTDDQREDDREDQHSHRLEKVDLALLKPPVVVSLNLKILEAQNLLKHDEHVEYL